MTIWEHLLASIRFYAARAAFPVQCVVKSMSCGSLLAFSVFKSSSLFWLTRTCRLLSLFNFLALFFSLTVFTSIEASLEIFFSRLA